MEAIQFGCKLKQLFGLLVGFHTPKLRWYNANLTAKVTAWAAGVSIFLIPARCPTKDRKFEMTHQILFATDAFSCLSLQIRSQPTTKEATLIRVVALALGALDTQYNNLLPTIIIQK
jgi:hypothetical protein